MSLPPLYPKAPDYTPSASSSSPLHATAASLDQLNTIVELPPLDGGVAMGGIRRIRSLHSMTPERTEAAHKVALHLLSGGSTGYSHTSVHDGAPYNTAGSSRRASIASQSETFAAEEDSRIGEHGIALYYKPLISSAHVTPSGMLYLTGPSTGARIRVEDLSQRSNIGAGFCSAEVVISSGSIKVVYGTDVILAEHTLTSQYTDLASIAPTVLLDLQAINDRLSFGRWNTSRQFQQGSKIIEEVTTHRELRIKEDFPPIKGHTGRILVEHKEGRYHCIYPVVKDHTILGACYGNGRLYCATDKRKILVIADNKPNQMTIIPLPDDPTPQPESAYIDSYRWVRAMQFTTYVHPTVRTIKENIAILKSEGIIDNASKSIKNVLRAINAARGALPQDTLQTLREAFQAVKPDASDLRPLQTPAFIDAMEILARPISSVVLVGNNAISIIKV